MIVQNSANIEILQCSNNNTTIVNRYKLVGQNFGHQQNSVFMIANYSDEYKPTQYFFNNAKLLFSKQLNIFDSQSAICNKEDFFVLDISIFHEQDEMIGKDEIINNKKFVVYNNDLNYRINLTNGNIHIEDLKDNLSDTLHIKILYSDQFYTNNNLDEVQINLKLLDVSTNTVMDIFKVQQTESGNADGFFLGHYYFKDDSTCLVSFNKFSEGRITVKILEYDIEKRKVKNINEIFIPNEGNSVSDVIFKELFDKSYLVTDNKNVFHVRSKKGCKKIYSAGSDFNIVYIQPTP